MLRARHFVLLCLFGAMFGLLCALAAPPAYAQGAGQLRAVDTSSPQATMRTLNQLASAIELAVQDLREHPSPSAQAELRRLSQKMVSLLDLSEVSPAARLETGRDAQVLLVDTLRRVDVPPLEQIPDEKQFPDVEKPAAWTVPGTEITIRRMMLGPKKGSFLFDASTISQIGEYYEIVKDLPLKVPARIPHWREAQRQLHGWMLPAGIVMALPQFMKVSVLDTPVWKIALTLLLIAALVLLLRRTLRWAGRRSEESRSKRYMRRLLLSAAVLLALLATTYLVAHQINVIGRFAVTVEYLLTIATYATLAWVAWLALFLAVEWLIDSPNVSDQSFDSNLLRLLARLAGLLGVGLIAGIGAQQLGVPIVGVIAGLGVGGLAVALAAQSSIENLIGGLNLYADRPIRVGDFCDYAGIQGNVEHIGLRSTRIRCLDRTVTSVPNSVIAKVHVTNYALRDQMLFRHTLDLRYDTTTQQLRGATQSILAYLESHPKVRLDVTKPRVHVVAFADWSIKLEIYAYVDATELPVFLKVQEELLMSAFELIRQTGAQLAFPTQTTLLETDAGGTQGLTKALVNS